jgi:phospholipid/cholesterol/gamma-HCH transport system substrate-binding protein
MAPVRTVPGKQLRKRTRMENERHYFLVGLFVLGGVLAIFVFTIWLTARDDSKYQEYRIHFAESVSGLSNGSDVKFRGVKVGNVKSIIIDPKDSRLIEVDILLLKSTPVKADTKANLKLQGITGVVFIELLGGDPSEPNLVNKDNQDQIPEIPAQQSSLNALIDRVPILLDKASASIDRFNKLLSDENLNATSYMLKNGDATMSQLHSIVGGSSKNINDSTRSAASAMRHLNKAAGQLENVSEDPSALIFPPDEKGVPAP